MRTEPWDYSTRKMHSCDGWRIVLASGGVIATYHAGSKTNQSMKKQFHLTHRQFLASKAISAGVIPAPKGRPLFYNYDAWNTFFLGADDSSIETNIALIADTGVTTLMLSPNVGQAFICRPGAYLEMCHGGVPPSPSELASFTSLAPDLRVLLEAAAAVVLRWSAEGVDPYAVALAKAKEMGLRVFITLRLNDVHTLEASPNGPYSDAFYRTHPGWRTGGGPTLDFGIAEVRQQRVYQIQELLERYAMIDGVELDFLRGPPFFNAADASPYANLMTDFVSQVANVSTTVANSRGRSLEVAVRVPSSLASCIKLGLDPQTWAQNGYIQAITLARFLRLTADLDVEAFKLDAPAVATYGCLEFLLSSGPFYRPRRDATAEAYRGIGAALYARGADGLYLYNMYATRTEDPPLRHFDPRAVLNQLPSPELLAQTNRLFLATRLDDADRDFENRPNVSLPASQLAPSASMEAEIYIGALNSSASHTLRIVGGDLQSATLSVELNGHILGHLGVPTSSTLFPELYNQLAPQITDCVDFLVPVDSLVAGRNTVVLQNHGGTSSAPIDIDAIELASRPPQRLTPEMIVVATTADTVRVSFTGLGGSRYRIERSIHLKNWSGLAIITMPPDGVYTYVDSAPLRVAGYYRAVSEVNPARVPSGIVVWWRAQDSAEDAIGSNNGSLQGGATFTEGKVGRAFLFNGTSSFIALSNNASMDFAAGDFTIETWCRFDSLVGAQEVLHKVTGIAPNDQTYFLEFSGFPDSPSLRFMVRDTAANQNDLVIPVPLASGLWYHIAAVRTGNTNAMYLDGVQIGSQTAGLSVNTGTGGIASIGNIAYNGTPGIIRYFAGAIDELSLYSKALSQSEIQAIHDAGNAGKVS